MKLKHQITGETHSFPAFNLNRIPSPLRTLATQDIESARQLASDYVTAPTEEKWAALLYLHDWLSLSYGRRQPKHTEIPIEHRREVLRDNQRAMRDATVWAASYDPASELVSSDSVADAMTAHQQGVLKKLRNNMAKARSAKRANKKTSSGTKSTTKTRSKKNG